MSWSRAILLIPSAFALACFTPNVGETLETDGSTTGSSDSTASTGASAGSTTDRPTTSTSLPPSSTGHDTDPIDTTTTLGPDVGSPTATGTCIDDDECGDLMCIDGECLPCGDATEPNQACADADPAAPFCTREGSCAACDQSACGGDTPFCDPRVGCLACTEHSQCPQSACHLGGPEQGACFDVNDVVDVSTADELIDVLNAAGPGTQTVVNLLGGSYTGGFGINDGAEVALLGAADTVLTGGATNLLSQQGGFLYLDRIRFDDGPVRAISVTNGSIWLDNVTIVNFGIGLRLLQSSARARRSQFVGGAADGTLGSLVQVEDGATLYAENSGFGPLGDPALTVSGGDIDLRYVTVAGNNTGISCTGGSSGQIRNSILANSGQTLTGCGSSNFSWIDNASDTASLGDVVGDYDPTWFLIGGSSRFLLSKSALPVFEGIADWDEGDPATDVEGDPRPTKERGYPGVDEP